MSIDTKALRDLLAAATPGEWVARRAMFDSGERELIVTFTPHNLVVAEIMSDETWTQDGAFIAAAHNAMPALLAEVKALRAALAPFTLSADELYETQDFEDAHPIPIVPDLPRPPDGQMLVYRVVPPGGELREGEVTVVWSHDLTMGDLRRASAAYGDQP